MKKFAVVACLIVLFFMGGCTTNFEGPRITPATQTLSKTILHAETKIQNDETCRQFFQNFLGFKDLATWLDKARYAEADLPENYVGWYDSQTDTIFLDPQLPLYSPIQRLEVVIHELVHRVTGLSHPQIDPLQNLATLACLHTKSTLQ